MVARVTYSTLIPNRVRVLSYVSGPFPLTGAWSIPSDAFPNIQNTPLPFITLEVVSVPEPTTLALVFVGIAGLVFSRWRKLY